MNKAILFIIIVAAIIILVIFFMTRPQQANTEISSDLKEISAEDFRNELEEAFNQAIKEAELPEKSIVIFDSYISNEEEDLKIKFEENDNTNEEFYMASTIKPLYYASVLKLQNIEDLQTPIPFKFRDHNLYLKEIALAMESFLTNGYQTDILLTEEIAPILKANNVSKYDDIFKQLTTNPELTELTIPLENLINYTMGPSSNWGLMLIRNYHAIQNNLSEEESVNKIEDDLNQILQSLNQEGTLVINLSTKSKTRKTLNTITFAEAEYLFQYFYENKFKLNSAIFDAMKKAMLEVSTDQVKNNRRHEIKSIGLNAGLNNANIIEKSGYIGFDYEAAPALISANDLVDLEPIEGKRIVLFDASSFTRIYLVNDQFIQVNYSISAPFYISKEPKFEELNEDYLVNKNRINDSLQKNIKPVLEEYESYIQQINQ